MLELTINEKTYQFNFNIAFMRSMNKMHREDAQKLFGEDARSNAGLGVAMMAMFIDDDIDELITVLMEANKGFEPRLKQKDLEDYLDDPDTDIEKVFEEVKNSLSSSNATRKEMKKVGNLLEELEKNETE